MISTDADGRRALAGLWAVGNVARPHRTNRARGKRRIPHAQAVVGSLVQEDLERSAQDREAQAGKRKS
jgi:hypothetical protein